tara:strand:- start:7413 stop:7742 length:330 start_codon:yes stop_codon:yes gene_type:complete
MQLKSGNFCPLVGKDCIQFECKFWNQIKGTNPQTGQEIDEWECTISMLPFLILEASQQARQAGAAVESFRNVSVEQTKQLTEVMVQAQEIVPAIMQSALNNKGIIEGSK